MCAVGVLIRRRRDPRTQLARTQRKQHQTKEGKAAEGDVHGSGQNEASAKSQKVGNSNRKEKSLRQHGERGSKPEKWFFKKQQLKQHGSKHRGLEVEKATRSQLDGKNHCNKVGAINEAALNKVEAAVGCGDAGVMVFGKCCNSTFDKRCKNGEIG